MTDEQHSLEGALKLLKGSKTKAEVCTACVSLHVLSLLSLDALASFGRKCVDGESAARSCARRITTELAKANDPLVQVPGPTETMWTKGVPGGRCCVIS